MEKIIFSKFSNDRRRELSTLTEIVLSNNIKKIRKVALFPEGEKHLEHINYIYHQLIEQYKDKQILINQCIVQKSFLQFEYIEGKTLKEIFDEFQRLGRKSEFLKMFEKVIDSLTCDLYDFTITREFQTVFGDVKFPTLQKSMKISNIDFIFENIIYDVNFNVIDYEWTFDFPIPFKFIIYRMIFYYMQNQNSSETIVTEDDMYSLYQISKEEKICYSKMEENFQNYILGGIHPLRELSHDWIQIMDISKEVTEPTLEFQVFMKGERGFSEEESYKTAIKPKDGHVRKVIYLEKNTDIIRIDPGNTSCLLNDFTLYIDDNLQEDFETNGTLINKKHLLFFTNDPQLILDGLDVTQEKIILEFDYLKLNEKTSNILFMLNNEINTVLAQKNRLEIDINVLEEEKNRIVLENNVKISNLEKIIEEKNTIVLSNNETISTLQKTKIDSEHKISFLQTTIVEKEEENNKLTIVIESILSSTSWKLTLPLRKMVELLKRK